MRLFAVVLFFVFQSNGNSETAFQHAQSVSFDTVVGALLRNELRGTSNAVARHLAPLLDDSHSNQAGMDAERMDQRRYALDSVSQPLAVLMRSLSDAGVNIDRATYLDVTLSGETLRRILQQLRIVRDNGWDEDATYLKRVAQNQRTGHARDCLTAGRFVDWANNMSTQITPNGHAQRVLRMLHHPAEQLPGGFLVVVPGDSDAEPAAVVRSTSAALFAGEATLLDGNHRAAALSARSTALPPLRMFVLSTPHAKRWRFWRKCSTIPQETAPASAPEQLAHAIDTSIIRTIIIWSSVEAKIQQLLLKRIQLAASDGLYILRQFHVSPHPIDYNAEWFKSFYGDTFYDVQPEGIVAHKGGGRFTLFLMQGSPFIAPTAVESVDDAMRHLKSALRGITNGRWQVHASLTASEARSDITFLFGKSLEEMQRALPQWPHNASLIFNHSLGRIVALQNATCSL